MTTIKPPGGPGASPTAAHMPELSPQADPTGPTESVPGTTGAAGSSEPPSTASSTASQRLHPHATTTQSMEGSVRTGGAAGAAGAAGANKTADVTRVAGARLGSDPAAALAAAVERGQLSMAQAIDQLVDLTVDGMAEHLSEAERLELTEVLQLALTSDPTFSAMRGEQG